MPQGDERIHRFPNAKLSDFQVGQVENLPNDTGLCAARVIFDVQFDGEEVVVKTWPATTANNEKARRIADERQA